MRCQEFASSAAVRLCLVSCSSPGLRASQHRISNSQDTADGSLLLVHHSSQLSGVHIICIGWNVSLKSWYNPFCWCITAPSCQESTASAVVGMCLSSLGAPPSAGASQLPAVRSPHHLQWLECVSQVLVQPLDSMLHKPCDESGLSQTALSLLVRPSLSGV